jgi:hypothetical protein
MTINKPNSQQLGIWRGVTTSFHILYFVINGRNISTLQKNIWIPFENFIFENNEICNFMGS